MIRTPASGPMAACMALGLKACACAASGTDTVTIEPIVGLSGRDVIACGVKFTTAGNGITLTAEFVLDDSRGTREFSLSARAPASLLGIALETQDATTATLLPHPVIEPDGSLVARGPIPGNAGSDFVRSLMVGGGTLRATLDGGHEHVIGLPGPLSQQVRASYLNCAGDLKKQP